MSSPPSTPADTHGAEQGANHTADHAADHSADHSADHRAVESDGGVDRRRAAIAGHTGDIDTARSLLDHAVPKVRGTALGALNRLGALTESELCDALADIDAGVRRRACEETARWSQPLPPSTEPSEHSPSDEPLSEDPLSDDPLPSVALPGALAEALTDRLLDDDDTVVEIAAWAWGERPPAIERAFELILTITTDHSDALCREAAVAALGALGDIRALPTILRATTDKATVRRRAIIALAPFDGPEVDEALERARSDRDWQVRQAAEDLSS